jgi:predicted deacetylase
MGLATPASGKAERMSCARDRLVLASIHDVSPRFEREVDQLLDLLSPHVGRRLAMLVVPNHWGDSPIVAGSAFARKLRRWADEGIEMFLHGNVHRATATAESSHDRLRARWMTAGEGEFLSLGADEALARVRDGRALLEDIIGRPVVGFVAPAWLYSDGAKIALKQSGMLIAEDHLRVWSPATGETLASGPVITWASRTKPRLASSLLAAPIVRKFPMRALRIGVHPPDVRHPALLRSIASTFKSAVAHRRPSAYAGLLS